MYDQPSKGKTRLAVTDSWKLIVFVIIHYQLKILYMLNGRKIHSPTKSNSKIPGQAVVDQCTLMEVALTGDSVIEKKDSVQLC